MKKTILLFAIMFVFAALVSNAQITNGGFEAWTVANPDGWGGLKTHTTGLTIHKVIDTDSVHGGVNACGLTNSTTSHKRFTSVATTVTSGTAYQISFWVMGTGQVRTGMFTGFNTGTSGYLTYNAYVSATGTWTQVTQTLVADCDTAIAEFIISVGTMGNVVIDDVTVTVGSIPTVPIHDIQFTTASPADSPYNNQVVKTGGIVTGKISTGFFLQSGSGLWNGVFVFDSVAASTLSRGDSVTFNATVTEYFTYTELKSVASLVKVSSGNTEPAPVAVTGANSQDEGTEAVLIKITDANCVSATNAFGVWKLYDTDSTFVDNLMYYYDATAGTHYDVTGVNYLSFSVVYLEPRDASDISIHNGISDFDNASVSIYPNPVSSNLFLNNIEGIEMIRISNILGETVNTIKVNSNNASLNVSNLSDGIYFVTLIDNNGVVLTKKFSKE